MCFQFNCSGFESETDTEEFEKVGQSPIDRQRTDVNVRTATTTTTTSSQFCTKPETVSMSTSTECISTQDTATLTEVRLYTKPESYSNNMMMTRLTVDDRYLTASHFLNNNKSHQSLINTINTTKSLPIPTIATTSPIPLSPPYNGSIIPNSIQSRNSDTININNNNKHCDINHVLSPIPECDSPALSQQQLLLHYQHEHEHEQDQQINCSNSIVDTDASSTSETSNSIGVCDKFHRSEFQSCQEDGDSEFVNSEFYIDESLPSSMTISDQILSTATGVHQQQQQPRQLHQQNSVSSDLGDDDCVMENEDDLQQLIAEIEIFSFDSCQSNDDKILMLLQVLLPHMFNKKKQNKQKNKINTHKNQLQKRLYIIFLLRLCHTHCAYKIKHTNSAPAKTK